MHSRSHRGSQRASAGDRVARRRVFALLGAITLGVAGCQAFRPGQPDTARDTPTGRLSSLAVDPMDGSVVAAGGGVFRAMNQARLWERLAVPADLYPDKLTFISTTTAAPARFYAAGPGAGVLRSDDRSMTWRAIGQSLPSPDVAAFTVHAVRPDTLYAWIDGKGVFRTEDGGQRWQHMDDGPPSRVLTLTHSTLEGSMNTGWLYAATSDGPYLSMDCF